MVSYAPEQDRYVIENPLNTSQYITLNGSVQFIINGETKMDETIQAVRDLVSE